MKVLGKGAESNDRMQPTPTQVLLPFVRRHWRSLLLLLVALGLLRTLKRGTVSEVPVDEVSAALVSAGGQSALPAAAVRELPAGTPSRGSDEPDLLELVDDNPDEVARRISAFLELPAA